MNDVIFCRPALNVGAICKKTIELKFRSVRLRHLYKVVRHTEQAVKRQSCTPILNGLANRQVQVD